MKDGFNSLLIFYALIILLCIGVAVYVEGSSNQPPADDPRIAELTGRIDSLKLVIEFMPKPAACTTWVAMDTVVLTIYK